jgi:hypothetical protein
MNVKSKYLDYYQEWVNALEKANNYIDMKDVCVKGAAFIGILNELMDADMICSSLALDYITEVNQLTGLNTINF